MKKIGINLIIGTIISIILIVISLFVIKPNYTYMTKFNEEIWLSTDNKTFSNENEIISYERKDNLLTVTYENNKFVYDSESGRTVFACDGKIFEAKYINGTISFESLTPEEIASLYKYIVLLTVTKYDNDKINVTTQKIICVILSLFIGYILSFLAYPVILYEKVKENQKLAFISASMTIVLCLASAFYIYFTLK